MYFYCWLLGCICLSVLLCWDFQRHFPFSKSEIESTWPTEKYRKRKPFDTWYHTGTCATLCVRFSSRSKAINIFPKHILKSKVRDQSIHASKKFFCHVIVKNYLWNVSWKFLIKIECKWRRKIKEQAPQLTWMYRGRTVKSSHRRCCIRKLLLKFSNIHRKHLCWSLFLNWVNYCWSYGSLNLLFYFFRYSLGHLDNRQKTRQ